MIVLGKYDFVSSSDVTVQDVLTSIGLTLGFYGFDEIYVALAPGSNQISIRSLQPNAEVTGDLPYAPITSSVLGGAASATNNWASNFVFRPSAGSNCSILLFLR